MGGNHPFGSPRLIDYCPHLLIAELLMNGMVHFAHDAARRADLDHLGVEPQLFADRLEALGYAVTDARGDLRLEHRMHEVEWIGVGIGVSTSRTQGVACSVDVWPDDRALVDASSKEYTVSSDLTHAGESRHQGPVGILSRPEPTHGWMYREHRLDPGFGDAIEMAVHIPHTGHYGLNRVGDRYVWNP